MRIRHAETGDARDIADLHVASWREAYRGILSQDYLDGLSVPERRAMWENVFALGAAEIFVAEDSGRIAGFTAFGPTRDDDADAETGEVYAIYACPSKWSSGIGRALWQLSRRSLGERGFPRATLWVLATNDRAIRFYERVGFSRGVGSETMIEIGGDSLLEVSMQCASANQSLHRAARFGHTSCSHKKPALRTAAGAQDS